MTIFRFKNNVESRFSIRKLFLVSVHNMHRPIQPIGFKWERCSLNIEIFRGDSVRFWRLFTIPITSSVENTSLPAKLCPYKCKMDVIFEEKKNKGRF